MRNWLFVEDFARGIAHALVHGAPGEVYNCGGPDERDNLTVVGKIIELTGRDESLIEFVTIGRAMTVGIRSRARS